LTRVRKDIWQNYFSSIYKIGFYADAREARNLFVIDFIIGFNKSNETKSTKNLKLSN